MKVLITNHLIIDIAGSEIVTLELARFFRSRGDSVEIATFYTDNPMMDYFLSDGFVVHNILNDENFRCVEYDLIWGHHSSLLDFLIFHRGITAKKIITSLLSPYEPLESPPVYANNLSLCLVNSEETKMEAVRLGVTRDLIHILPNSTSSNFFEFQWDNLNRSLNSIAVVSNHLPDEVRDAGNLLAENGIKFHHFGVSGNYTLITPELLASYDAVITIGKTVQFCLALSLPVYCYDRFGGPGWITTQTINHSSRFNFSGRCSASKKTAEQIYREITCDFSSVKEQANLLKVIARDNYSLEKNLCAVLESLKNSPDVSTQSVYSFQLAGRQIEYYVRELRRRLGLFAELQECKEIILEKNRHIDRLLNTFSWKITAPLRRISAVVRLFIEPWR